MSNLEVEIAKKQLLERHRTKRESFQEYVKYIYKQEFGKEFVVSAWHRQVFKMLEKVRAGKIKRLLVSVAPGAGKTDIFTKLFTTWCIGNNPAYRVIVTGYSAALTEKFSGEARSIYQSEAFFDVFPYRPDLLKDSNTKELWVNKKGGQFKASGTGGVIVGLRGELIVVDDPLKPDDAKSDVVREGVNQWFDETLYSRLNNYEEDAIIVVHQRLHENDLIGYLLEKKDKNGKQIWEHLNISAIAEEDEGWRKAGESYFPERYSVNALEMIRANNPLMFETQYQQNPMSILSQEFFPEFFKHYTEVDLQRARIFTVVDPAFSQKKRADQSCIMTGAFLDDRLYILEYVANRYSATDLIEAIIYQVNKWKPEALGVESQAAQTLLVQQLENEFRARNIYRTIKPIKNTDDKEQRIRNLERLIRYGQILWQKDMIELETQFKTFPRGKHDDIIDCVTFFYKLYTPQSETKGYKDINFNIKYSATGRPMFKF